MNLLLGHPCSYLGAEQPHAHPDEVPEECVEDDGDCVGDRHGDREVRVEHLLQLSLLRRVAAVAAVPCGRRVPVGRDIPGSIVSLLGCVIKCNFLFSCNLQHSLSSQPGCRFPVNFEFPQLPGKPSSVCLTTEFV